MSAAWLPAPWHRAGLRVAHAIRLGWWRVRQPLLVGCRVLAINPHGEVLLVRHSYGSRMWMLPGGGIARGEAPIAAAARELFEETGCTLSHPVEVAVIRGPLHGTTSVEHVVAGTTRDLPRPDGREITAARCFAPDLLPTGTSPLLAERLAEWLTRFASEQG